MLTKANVRSRQMPSENTMTEHAATVNAVISEIRASLVDGGTTCDDSVKHIDGKFIGLFVVPSQSSLYIGYGSNGSRKAFFGNIVDLDIDNVTNSLMAYAHDVQ